MATAPRPAERAAKRTRTRIGLRSLPIKLDTPPMEAQARRRAAGGDGLAVRAEVGRLPLPRLPRRRRGRARSPSRASRWRATSPRWSTRSRRCRRALRARRRARRSRSAARSRSTTLLHAHPSGGEPRRASWRARRRRVLIALRLLVDADGAAAARRAAERAARARSKRSRRALRRAPRICALAGTRDRAPARALAAPARGGELDGVDRQAPRPALPARASAAMQKVKRLRTADCVVGGFRYADGSRDGRLAAARPLRRRGPAAPRRLHLDASRPPSGKALTEQARAADRAARLHRQRAGRPEPLEHRAQRRVGAAAARAGGRGALRPLHRRPLPPRHAPAALAPRQGAGAVRLRSIASARRRRRSW